MVFYDFIRVITELCQWVRALWLHKKTQVMAVESAAADASVVRGNPGVVVWDNHCMRGNGHMLPFTFQNVSLSSHVNFPCRPVQIHEGSGFHSCPRPCSSTLLWARFDVRKPRYS